MNQHNLLGYHFTLLNCAEAEDVTQSRVRLFVTMGHTHATTCGYIESSKLTLLVHNGDETEIIREEIYVVVWRYRDSDFELTRHEYGDGRETETKIRTFRGK